jgi:hypothetical protein
MTPHSQTSRRDPTFDPVSVTRFVAPIDGGRVIEISSSPMCCRRHCEPESAMMPLKKLRNQDALDKLMPFGH